MHGIAFNSDGTLLGSGGGDYYAKIWLTYDMTGPNYDPHAPYHEHDIQPVYTLSGHYDSVFAVAFSPDGCHVKADNRAVLKTDKTKQPLDFDDAGCRVATSGYDRTIRIWDFNQLKEDVNGDKQPQTVGTLSGHDGTVLALAFSNDGKLLTSGASDGGVDLWDPYADRLLDRFQQDDTARPVRNHRAVRRRRPYRQ